MAVMVAAMIIGCSSGSATRTATPPAVQVVPTSIPFKATTRQNQDAVECVVTANRILATTDSFTSEWLLVGDGDARIMDATGAEVFRSRHGLHMAGKNVDVFERKDVTLTGVYSWVVPDSITTPIVGTAHVRVLMHDGRTIFDTVMPWSFDPSKRAPLKMRLGIEKEADGNYTMTMTVRRLHPSPDWYLPTSQTHDWMVLDPDGRPMWQQSLGSMFMQVINPVDPAGIGEEVSYTDTWDGKGNYITGIPRPGMYRLVGIIPCKPQPVLDTISFRIK